MILLHAAKTMLDGVIQLCEPAELEERNRRLEFASLMHRCLRLMGARPVAPH